MSIAVAVVNAPGISTVLRKARAKGIKVLTWDADAEPDARDFFINQATPQGIGDTLADEANRILHGSGDFAIITGALTAANQNEWIKFIKARIAEKYPNLHLITIRPSDDDRNRAFSEAQTLMKVYPEHEADHGHLRARGARRGGSREAIRPAGREGDRPFPAEHVQALCQGGDRGVGGSVEHRQSGLSGGGGVERWRRKAR